MTGKLYAVGVGPGDPELITLKALKTIKNADCIVSDGRLWEAVTADYFRQISLPNRAV